MNKAILIVICDFLVSAMLSMMTGMVAAHSGGTGVGLDENTTRMLLTELENKSRELEKLRSELRRAADNADNSAELRRLAQLIAANRLQQESLKKQLNATQENTGELTPAQLKKLLDEEKLKRFATEIELKTRSEVNAEMKTEIAQRKKETSELRRDLNETAKNISKMSREYAETRSRLAGVQEKLSGTEQALETEKRISRKAEVDLSRVSEALREMTSRFNDANQQAQNAQNSLAYIQGRFQSAERDAADYKGQNIKLERELAQLKLNHRDELRRNDELRRTVRKAVQELTDTKVDLAKAQTEVQRNKEKFVRSEARLEAARQQLDDARKLLKTDVLELYSKASVALDINIKARNVFTGMTGGGTYFLPVIDFNGELRIAGNFSTFCGDGEKPLIFNRVTELGYTASPAADPASAKVKLTGNIQCLKSDLRAASIQAGKIPGIKPLKYLDRTKLRKRGFQQLVLFKNSGGKRDVVDLENRCFLDLSQGDRYLFIRNDSRSVRVSAGDIVLTREGDFVGVAVKVDRMGERAAVYVFPAENPWGSTLDIPTAKRGGSYQAFTREVSRIKELIFESEKR